MLICFDALLSQDAANAMRLRLEGGDWSAGSATAAGPAKVVKHNEQLPTESALAIELGESILRALGSHPEFLAAALPERILPPRFNRYSGGSHYGTHIDAALMRDARSGQTLRTDLSATLFLSDPEDYEGGELEIETAFGAQSVKLSAGSLVLYPASSLHRVTPVTRGARLAAFFWIQSVVPDTADRELLYDLDRAIRALSPDLDATDERLASLTGLYHNLLRRWARP